MFHLSFVYTDGGPDHQVMYLLGKLTIIAAFLALDLNVLCACCAPVERVMAVLPSECRNDVE